MLTHQMCLMDPGNEQEWAFVGYIHSKSSNGATAVGIQRLSNLNKRLVVRMTVVV